MKYKLRLPEGDPRTARVVFAQVVGELTTLSIVIDERPTGVRKAKVVGGNSMATGTIVSEFKTLAGATRYVFEFRHMPGDLHIMTPEQLEIE